MTLPPPGNNPGEWLLKMLIDAIKGRKDIELPPVKARRPDFSIIGLEGATQTPFVQDTLSQLFSGPYQALRTSDKSHIFRSDPRTIYIDERNTPEQDEDAILHELVHSSLLLEDPTIPREMLLRLGHRFLEGREGAWHKKISEAAPRAFEVAMNVLRGNLPAEYLDLYDEAVPGSAIVYDFLLETIKDKSDSTSARK